MLKGDNKFENHGVNLELQQIISKLALNKNIFKDLLNAIDTLQINWRPAPEKWSFLEVACHLLDEEREDFRQRIDFMLHKQGEKWLPIDPQGWVNSRNYEGQDFEKTVKTFLNERQKSIDWLKGLNKPAWENSYQHPEAGKLTAKQMLANWLAHDYLHIRQLNRMNYLYLKEISQPLSLDYAGDW